jgi:hypothetical protein
MERSLLPMVSTRSGVSTMSRTRVIAVTRTVDFPDSFCPVSIRLPRAKWKTSGSSKSQ